MVDAFRSRFPVPLVHLWHEDRGFRLAKMRNMCIARATGDYIVQIDGDLILHPDFIADHAAAARPGAFLKGTRVLLGKSFSDAVCASKNPPPSTLRFYSRGIAGKAETAIRCPLLARIFARWFKRHHISGLGCNMSFWRDDVVAINGYDERYEGWGQEDDDLAHRLYRYGCRKRALRFAGIVFHLWHRERTAQNETHRANLAYCREQDLRQVVRCESGLDQYLAPRDDC